MVDFSLFYRSSLSVITLLIPLYCGVAWGQTAVEESEASDEVLVDTPPVGVLNIASVDRVTEDVHFVFDSVGRDDMKDVVDSLLNNLGNLDGMDRSKPFGVMLFLKPGLVPQPIPVAYLPVTDIAALTKTLELGPVTTKKLADDRYEIVGRRRSFYARLVGGYAFASADEEILDREFPLPGEAFGALTTRYDVAIEVRPENIPPGMRELFLSVVRTRTQSQLQQRDNEPDAAYALRKSQGMNNLRLVEAFLKETESIRLGLDTSPANRKAVLELVIDAIPGTSYLETLQGLAEEPSLFAPILDDDVSLSVSINSRLDDASKAAQKELLNFGELRAAQILTRLDQGDGLGSSENETGNDVGDFADPIAMALSRRIFEPLKAVVDSGNLDGFVQFRGNPESKFVVIAGLEVPGASGMEGAVREFIDRVRNGSSEAASSFNVEYGVGDAGGVNLHRVTGREVREQEKNFYGEEFGLYFGFDSNTIWFAVGGPQAVTELDGVVTRVKEATAGDRIRSDVPIKLVLTANRWIGLDQNERNLELAKEAFEEVPDKLRIDFRPTEKGGRLRIEVEEGFIRLLGLGVSRRFDESQL